MLEAAFFGDTSPDRSRNKTVSVAATLDTFRDDPDTTLKCLQKYPVIKDLFILMNTPLPSTAPVERLFSMAALILLARRSRLSDDVFELLVLQCLNG